MTTTGRPRLEVGARRVPKLLVEDTFENVVVDWRWLVEFFSAPYVEQHQVRIARGQTTLAAKLALSSSEVAAPAAGWENIVGWGRR